VNEKEKKKGEGKKTAFVGGKKGRVHQGGEKKEKVWSG